MTAPASFRQADLTRALKAARKAGISIESFSVDRNGTIKVESVPDRSVGGFANPWDAELAP